MDSISENLTQENVPRIFISVYNPEDKQDVFSFKFNEPQTYEAHEMVTFGRKNTCNFQLNHGRASRLQFQIQAFLTTDSSNLKFEIKNLSNRFALFINGHKLDYLQKQLLPWKSVLKFTEFKFYLEQEEGDSVSNFEVVFRKGFPSLCLETDARYIFPNGHHDPREPLEVGEDLDQDMLL
ncbi:TRAF-interacting protein with FHA domain-containing protein A-like isoform X2 [Narcine bancroftii]